MEKLLEERIMEPVLGTGGGFLGHAGDLDSPAQIEEAPRRIESLVVTHA